MKIKILLTDDDGQIYEREIELVKTGSKKTSKKLKISGEQWYQPGSTVAKIIDLINEGFFDVNQTIGDVVEKLKSMDFHYKSSDLTLPLRKIVCKALLTRTKELPDGRKSRKWTDVKN
ncbi:MAG: hypothetical protein ACREAK_05305 [Nitrosarchaeum sp.]